MTAAALDQRPDEVLAALLADLPAGPRVVLVDGRHRPDLSDLPRGDGVSVDAGSEPGAIRVDSTANGAVHIVYLAVADRTASPRTEIVIAPDTNLELIETFRSSPGAGRAKATTAIEVRHGGHLDHLRVLQTAPGTHHEGSTDIVVHEAAAVRAAMLVTGGGESQHALTASIVGDGGDVVVAGLAAPVGGAHHDTPVTVRHQASNSRSRQQFVSIVPDGGRTSFTGYVVVAAGTTGTDADMQNRNLLLGPTARADTRPWLQIDSDDVACTHGATVGRLDDDSVFYLRSRGIPEDAARAMLTAAFARSTLDEALPPGPGRDWLAASGAAAIAATLADGVAATRSPVRGR